MVFRFQTQIFNRAKLTFFAFIRQTNKFKAMKNKQKINKFHVLDYHHNCLLVFRQLPKHYLQIQTKIFKVIKKNEKQYISTIWSSYHVCWFLGSSSFKHRSSKHEWNMNEINYFLTICAWLCCNISYMQERHKSWQGYYLYC